MATAAAPQENSPLPLGDVLNGIGRPPNEREIREGLFGPVESLVIIDGGQYDPETYATTYPFDYQPPLEPTIPEEARVAYSETINLQGYRVHFTGGKADFYTGIAVAKVAYVRKPDGSTVMIITDKKNRAEILLPGEPGNHLVEDLSTIEEALTNALASRHTELANALSNGAREYLLAHNPTVNLVRTLLTEGDTVVNASLKTAAPALPANPPVV